MPFQLDITKILPVAVSILVIITVAILRNYSRSFAAIAAVMPLNIPLGMWIVYAGAQDKQQAMVEFNGALLLNIVPTLVFMIVVWQGARAGWPLVPLVGMGYVVWGVSMGLIFALRYWLR